MRSRYVVLTVLFSVIVPVLAAKFWESKDYTAWTGEECQEILSKSPWAIQYSQGHVGNLGGNVARSGGADSVDPRSIDWGRTEGETYGGEREIVNILQFRLLSAKPIRMALGRLQLLEQPGNAAVDEQVAEWVNDPQDRIILQISYFTRPAGASSLRDIDSFFRQASLSDFQANTYLVSSDKKKNVGISAYLKPDDKNSNPVFIFPKTDEAGNPHFTGNEKSITLKSELRLNVLGRQQKYDVYLKMDPKKMRFQQQFAM
jgi:hypothetical protein